ncbi:MAG: TonB-dependent receptor [Steroidobacteraceae bacterium]
MRKYLLGSSLVTTAMLSSVAWSQESTSTAFELEEITVTATKRETDLQKTAMSVTALKGDELRTAAKNNLSQILEGVAGLETAGAGSGQGSQFFIRGVGFVPAFGQDAAVTTSVNGVFLQQAQSSRASFYDLDRVEVSRGPQSTLQGRNALGGSISLVSAEPKLEYEASGTINVGNYGLLGNQGMINFPLSDILAVRASFSSEKRDGYLINGQNDSDVVGGRVRTLFKPNDDIKLIVTADYSKQKGKGAGFSNTGLVIPSQLAANGFGLGKMCTPSLTPNSSGVYAPSDCLGIVTLYPAGSPAATPAGTVSGTTAAFSSLADVPNEYWNPNPAEPQERDFRTVSYTMDLTWDLGFGSLYFQPTYLRTDYKVDIMNFNLLTYVTRLQQAVGSGNLNPYAYAAGLSNSNGKEESWQKQSTYELRLSSSEDSKLKWLGGLYYFMNKQATNVSMGSSLYCVPVTVGTTPPFCNTSTPPSVPTSPTAYSVQLPAFDATLYPEVGHRWTRDYAGYAQVTYPIVDKLRVTGSARWTQETKWRNTAIGNQVLPSGQVINAGFTYLYDNGVAGTTATGNTVGYPVLERKTTWNHIDYRGVVEYDITPESMVYGSISTGFRGGSFMNLPTDGLSAGFKNYYDPEYLTSYEVGMRNEFFDRTVRANFSAFYYDYTDYQYSYAALGVFDNATAPGLYDPATVKRNIDPDFTFNYTANAAKATSYGGELETSWVVTERDQLGLNVSYTHGRFGDVSLPGAATATVAAAAASLKDAPLPRSPEWSVSPSYKHRFDLGSRGGITFGADANYKSKIYFLLTGDVALRELYTQEAVTKYNSSLAFDSADGKWNVTTYVRNLTNEASLENLTTTALTLTSNVPTSISYSVAEPRTYGATITAKF